MLSTYLTEIAIKTYSIFDNLFNINLNMNNDKNFIIDPLTCMIRLAMLSFKQPGTKISIIDNKISFNEPSFLQGTIRWSQGDNRDDLHNLYRPILKSLEWYDLSKDEIVNIYEMSIKGLDRLKAAYKDNSTIIHSLELYKKLIIDKMNSKETVQQNNTENVIVNKIYMDLKNLWNTNEVVIINSLFEEIKKSDEYNISSLMEALNNIIYTKEEKVKRIILEHTTLL